MRLIRADAAELKDIYATMTENFIPDEVRDYADMERLYGNGKYTVLHIEEKGRRIGFMSIWTLKDFVFLEHFVVYPDYRNNGSGGRALTLLQEKYGAVVLEAEPPAEPIQIRRINFYERHGMRVNPQYYRQPPYRETGSACPMKLMSYPELLPDFEQTVKEIYGEVYGRDYP